MINGHNEAPGKSGGITPACVGELLDYKKIINALSLLPQLQQEEKKEDYERNVDSLWPTDSLTWYFYA